MSAAPRIVHRDRTEDEDRVFHLSVREAMLLVVRAYTRRFLPDIKNGNGQTKGNRGIE